MKPSRHLIKAFTIMELTVVMLISAIVIGITYTGYIIMSRSYLGFTKKNESMGVIVRLDELLKKDFEKSEIVTIGHHTLTFRDSAGLVTYQLTPDFILRNSLIADTFKVNTSDFLTSFKNHPTRDNDSDSSKTQIADDLSFNLLFKGDTIIYHYHKIYSSQDLLKDNPYAFN